MRQTLITGAKAHLLQIIDDVERGETVITTRHGRPVVRIVPERQSRDDKARQTMRDIAAFR